MSRGRWVALTLAGLGTAAAVAAPPRARKDSFTVDLIYRGATRNVYRDVGEGELTRVTIGDGGKFEIQLVGRVEDPESDKTHPIEARGRYMLERITAHVVKEAVDIPPLTGITDEERAGYRVRLRKVLPCVHLVTLGGAGTHTYMALGALLKLETKDVGTRRETTVTEAGDMLAKFFHDVESGGGLRLSRLDFSLPRRRVNLVFRFP